MQTEVDSNRQNEQRINQLEREYTRCEQEIQDLNKEIERLENASKEEIVKLKSKISILKNQPGSRLLIIKVTIENWPFTNRFYLTFFLNSIGLLAKKEKNYNNVT